MDSGKDKDAPGGKTANEANAGSTRPSARAAETKTAAKTKSREDRLAEALRANLRRRKSATKSREMKD